MRTELKMRYVPDNDDVVIIQLLTGRFLGGKRVGLILHVRKHLLKTSAGRSHLEFLFLIGSATTERETAAECTELRANTASSTRIRQVPSEKWVEKSRFSLFGIPTRNQTPLGSSWTQTSLKGDEELYQHERAPLIADHWKRKPRNRYTLRQAFYTPLNCT